MKKMKHSMLMVAAIVLNVSAFGQNLFLEDGKVWKYKWSFGGDGQEYFYDRSIAVTGDTVVSDKACKVLKLFDDSKAVSTYVMYEEGDKVYEVDNNGDFNLCYDFSLNVGDVFEFRGYSGSPYMVSDVRRSQPASASRVQI